MNHQKVVEILAEFSPPPRLVEEYDSIANLCSLQFFNACIEKGDTAALRPFFTIKGTDNDTPPLYVTALGQSPIPTGYREYIDNSMTYIYEGKQVKVEVLDATTFDYRKNHPIEVPDKAHPIANFQNVYIRFLPKNLQYVNASYLRNPVWVHMATTTVTGFPKYDPTNSVEFEWDDSYMVYVIQLILNQLEIPATIDQLREIQTKNK